MSKMTLFFVKYGIYCISAKFDMFRFVKVVHLFAIFVRNTRPQTFRPKFLSVGEYSSRKKSASCRLFQNCEG